MEIRESIQKMDIEEVRSRIDAIKTEMDLEDADIDALSLEFDELEERAKEINKIAEERAALKDKVLAEGKVTKTVEERKDEPKMEIRDSLEYGQAYLKFFKEGKDEECRALLTTNASGTVPMPTMLETEIKNAWEDCQLMSLVKQTNFKGIVKVGYEVSADGATVHVEGAEAPTEEALVWGTVELKPENIKKWITVSDEAIEGTTIDTLGEIYKEVAQRIVEKAEEVAIAKIVASSLTASLTASTIDVDTITNALAELSGKAKNITLVMNRRTYANFKAASKKAHYGVDPFDGCKVIFTDALKSFASASASDAYVVAGDFGYGFQANFPNGKGAMTMKLDDVSLAEKDLVKVVGRQYVGMGVVAPKALVKIVK